MESFKDKTKEIKEYLQKGIFVVAPRGSGKTRAIAELLLENRDMVAVVGSESGVRRLVKMLQDSGLTETYAQTRVLHAAKAKEHLFGDRTRVRIIVDEYFKSRYNGPFYAATASQDIKVIL